MKKLFIAASIALMTACSAPQQAQISLLPQASLSTSDIVQGKSLALTSKDMRTAQYIALVDSGHSRVEPIHAAQNLRLTLDSALQQQFESQGFSVVPKSNNVVTLTIDQALVSVTHSVMSNEMSADITLEVTAETPEGKMVRTYKGTATKTGAMSASNDDIQLIFNDVMNLVLNKIGTDDELRNYMKERF